MNMSDQVELTNPVDLSIGGMNGHLFRRAIHIAMSALPWIYFEWGREIADAAGTSNAQLVSMVIMFAILVEGLRLKLGFTIFGQREYEAHQVSALAWGAFGVGMVFLLVPTEAYAWPLVLSLSLGDPFMGELRRRGIDTRNVVIYSSMFIGAIWVACWFFFETPLWLALVFGPLCVAAEWPRLRYIDDNATMTLIPLGVIMLLEPFLLLLP
jgi:hypothetical protein